MLTFGLMVDLQILVSTWRYQPVAFDKMPSRALRATLLSIGGVGMLITLAAYVSCLLVFSGINDQLSTRKLVYICFLFKALTWSPFLGMELYDTIFEQIYHDVQFQLNVVRPVSSSRSTSPLPLRRKASSKRLSNIAEEEPTLLRGAGSTNDPAREAGKDNEAGDANFKSIVPVDLATDQEVAEGDRLVIHQVSECEKSLTGSSLPDTRLERELNLTEAERRVRRANGLPTDEPPVGSQPFGLSEFPSPKVCSSGIRPGLNGKGLSTSVDRVSSLPEQALRLHHAASFTSRQPSETNRGSQIKPQLARISDLEETQVELFEADTEEREAAKAAQNRSLTSGGSV